MGLKGIGSFQRHVLYSKGAEGDIPFFSFKGKGELKEKNISAPA